MAPPPGFATAGGAAPLDDFRTISHFAHFGLPVGSTTHDVPPPDAGPLIQAPAPLVQSQTHTVPPPLDWLLLSRALVTVLMDELTQSASAVASKKRRASLHIERPPISVAWIRSTPCFWEFMIGNGVCPSSRRMSAMGQTRPFQFLCFIYFVRCGSFATEPFSANAD